MLGADIDGVDKTQDFVQKNIWYANSNKHAKQINLVNIGDKVAIKTAYVQKNNLPFRNYGCDVSCMKIKAIGEVIENLKNGRELKINWTLLPKERIIFLKTYRSTISCVRRTDVQQMVFENQIQNYNELEDIYRVRGQKQGNRTMEQKSIQNKKVVEQPLNRILFGAAGTGKTYHTINHALSIIENKSLEELEMETREELKKRFDTYKTQGQINFITFHQSFSYEDFVEGIRAKTDENGNLIYDVQAGIFKEICDLAKTQSRNNIIGAEFGRGYILKSVSSDALVVHKPNGNLIHLSTDLANLLLEKVIQKKITIEDISQKNVLEKLEENNPLLEPYIVNGYCTVWANLIQLMLDCKGENIKPNLSYVLIIDEINRGNISRIFGELITLIEDSKRAGAAEELSVILPYSKKEFTIPHNLYLIGTMNSSDRSLTGLDIALRRRFTFIEMPPKPEEIKDENGVLIEIHGQDQSGEEASVIVAELLKVMNQRIEVLLDRDHCIGHANFMSLRKQPTLENLAHIFKQKIIPQLQEYFFDDWSKISLVLYQNGMIIEDNEINISALFPANAQLDIDYSEQKKIWKINDEAFKTIDAFIKILGTKG
ncbi:AAA family ATPase [Acinetobacter sp. GD03873]|nr:AAA family ATPase [Acinetobacter sp. GD03873]MDH0886227.1 AAA family ATPase [Acinetobacter sp. GD03873]